MTDYMYHITKVEYLDGIMNSEGIKAKRSKYNTIIRLNFFAPKGVYLSRHPVWFGMYAGMGKYDFENNIAVLKIDVTGLDIDREYAFTNAYLFKGNISKNRIIDIFYMSETNLEYELKRFLKC